MITFKDLLGAVEDAGDVGISIGLPDGASAPAHFHITEVAGVTRDFIDCGGTRRKEVSCVLQTYVADDFAHRLRAPKFLKILEASSDVVPDGELPVEFDYQQDSITRYALQGVELVEGDESRLVFQLATMQTDCLAKDKCGITPPADAVQIVSTVNGGTLDIGGMKSASWGST